jgi:hypothetical protein
MKSLSGNDVTGFLWVRAVTIAMQQLSKQTLNSGTTFFLWGLCRGVIGATEQFSVGDSLKMWIRGVSSRREFRSVKVLFEVCYEDYEEMEYWHVRL